MALSRPGPVFDLLGARYWIVPGARQEPPGWSTVGQVESGFVYENPRALPRAFFVARSVNLIDGVDRLKFLSAPDFDARSVVVTERDSGGLPDGGLGGSVSSAAGMDAGRYTLVTESGGAGFLILTEAWYPGWSVEVDGVPAELLRTDHLFQGVRLAAGRHDVTFQYRSKWFAWGLAIAAAAATASLAMLVRGHRQELALQRLPGAP
jgi:hypothetical protein